MRNVAITGTSGYANPIGFAGAGGVAGIGFAVRGQEGVPLYGRFAQYTGAPSGMRFGRSLIWPIKDGGLGATQPYVPAPIISAALTAIGEIGGSAAGSVTINADETEGRIIYGSSAGAGTATVTVSGPGRIAASVVIGFRPSADDIAFTLLDTFEVESGLTVRQALRLISSALAGKVSGAGGSTIVFRDVNDTKNRITATVDGNGNRTAVTRDVS